MHFRRDFPIVYLLLRQMSSEIVSHIKGLISFMKSVDELFKSISTELIVGSDTSISCAADSDTLCIVLGRLLYVDELFQYTCRMDILHNIDIIMPKLCEYATKNKDPELQAILMQYPYISTCICNLFIIF